MIDLSTLFDAIKSHAMATGLFEDVITHEPKSAPGNGLTCATWLDSVVPVGTSGLAATSGLVTFTVQLYTPMLQEPQDAIDVDLLAATNDLLQAYSGDFDLDDDNVRGVDLLGAYGPGLSAKAAYVQIDKTLYRVMTITVPVVVNDLWAQSP